MIEYTVRSVGEYLKTVDKVSVHDLQAKFGKDLYWAYKFLEYYKEQDMLIPDSEWGKYTVIKSDYET